MVSVAAVGGALTMHSSPMLGLVRETIDCGRYGLFRWEYDYHSLFNTITGCSAGNTITTVSLTRSPWNPPQKKTLNMTVTQNESEIMMMMMK